MDKTQAKHYPAAALENGVVHRELPPPSAELGLQAIQSGAQVQLAQRLLEDAPEPHHRVPALDGVRGVAILLVLAFHFLDIGYPKFLEPFGFLLYNWGWTGVDLFFVLSGFLITGILIEAKGSPGYFRNFYGRRAIRIFPAYAVLLIIIIYIIPALWPHFLDRGDLPVFGPAWGYWLYVQNYVFALGGNAFGSLGHTWSLAVEEQFYLIWPALIILLSRRRMVEVCCWLIVGALALRLIFLGIGVPIWPIYLMSITRADTLAMGALIALLVRSPKGLAILPWTRWMMLIGPIGVAALWLLKKKYPNMEWFEQAVKFTCIAGFFAAFLAFSVTTSQKSFLNRSLSTKFLRFFGRYSYAMYLFHVPFYLAVKQYWGPPADNWHLLYEDIFLTAGTILFALLSWNLVEKHMLKLKRFFPAPDHKKAARPTT